FCQAEDGIRDFHVTGVQTCALPISLLGSTVLESCLVPERAAGGECRGRARPINNIPEPGRVVNSKGAGHRAASPGDGSGPGQGQDRKSVVEGKGAERGGRGRRTKEK